ncbi:MAG: PaaI family thioesterase [SAR324 cluster bacterium]|nr:PaaI family thioesterase [SAR324 cluster bacterium]
MDPPRPTPPVTACEAQDPDFERRVQDSFGRQTFMRHLGAQITALQAGYCEISLDYRDDLAQQHGFFHGGIIGTLADNASGYASYSLMPVEATVLTVEYKLNLLAPGDGERIISRGRVLKPGRTLIIAQSDVYALKRGRETHCATALVTLFTLAGTPDHPGMGKQ